MKKIFILTLIILIISSCWLDNQDNTVVDNNIVDNNISTDNSWETVVFNDEVFKEIELNYYQDIGNVENSILYAEELRLKWKSLKQEKEYADKAILATMNTFNMNYDNESKSKERAELLRIMGHNSEILEDFDKAIIAYNQAIGENENNYQAYNDLWNVYKIMWKDKESEDAFKKAEEIMDVINSEK